LPTEEELKAELEREKRMILEEKGVYEIRRAGRDCNEWKECKYGIVTEAEL